MDIELFQIRHEVDLLNFELPLCQFVSHIFGLFQKRPCKGRWLKRNSGRYQVALYHFRGEKKVVQLWQFVDKVKKGLGLKKVLSGREETGLFHQKARFEQEEIVAP